MIYLDSSVAMAELLGENKRPDKSFWAATMASSRLLEYEILVRHHSLRRSPRAITIAQRLISKVQLTELDALPLTRALQPFPVSVRTLDAIHLSTMDFLRSRGITLQLATYDARLAQAATALGFALVAL